MMKINLYENLILTIFLISGIISIYIIHITLLLVFYYRKKTVDDVLNKLFKKKNIITNNIKTSKDFIFFLKNQIIFYIFIPSLIFVVILITHFKLIYKILITFKNEFIYIICLFLLFNLTMTYYIIFYSSNYLHI
jgi:hypothetical protein